MVRVNTDGPIHEAERTQMRSSSCPAIDAPHAVGADLSGTQHEQEAQAAQDLALSAEEFGDRSAEPSLVRGYHLYPDAAWLPVSRGNHGLVQSQGLGVAAVQQHGRGVLR